MKLLITLLTGFWCLGDRSAIRIDDDKFFVYRIRRHGNGDAKELLLPRLLDSHALSQECQNVISPSLETSVCLKAAFCCDHVRMYTTSTQVTDKERDMQVKACLIPRNAGIGICGTVKKTNMYSGGGRERVDARRDLHVIFRNPGIFIRIRRCA
jgi:hypothetical protein